MAMTLTDIYAAISALNQIVSNLAASVSTLPRSTATSSAAPSAPGAITFSSSQATGFLIMQTSSGTSVKVPTYSNP